MVSYSGALGVNSGEQSKEEPQTSHGHHQEDSGQRSKEEVERSTENHREPQTIQGHQGEGSKPKEDDGQAEEEQQTSHFVHQAQGEGDSSRVQEQGMSYQEHRSREEERRTLAFIRTEEESFVLDLGLLGEEKVETKEIGNGRL